MRKILFRGKTEQFGNWIEGSLVIGRDLESGQLECLIAPLSAYYTEVKKVMPETVGQYTGLTDKNGTKIFEGDVVKETDIKHKSETKIKGKIYEIKMYKGAWIVKNHKGKLDYEKWDFLNTFAPKVEVIGNIHDNPELLGNE